MQLSLHSDYALRALIYLGTRPGEVVSTREISQAYGISKHHLARVVQTLGQHGYVDLLAGRGGGVRLARDPGRIRLGDVVSLAEANLDLVECFDPATNTCPIIDSCLLKGALKGALRAFIAALNEQTLADVLSRGRDARLASTFIQVRRRRPG